MQSAMTQASFNSTKVRLKGVRIVTAAAAPISFNSTKVRLKVP